jgi:hypothetical protein
MIRPAYWPLLDVRAFAADLVGDRGYYALC